MKQRKSLPPNTQETVEKTLIQIRTGLVADLEQKVLDYKPLELKDWLVYRIRLTSGYWFRLIVAPNKILLAKCIRMFKGTWRRLSIGLVVGDNTDIGVEVRNRIRMALEAIPNLFEFNERNELAIKKRTESEYGHRGGRPDNIGRTGLCCSYRFRPSYRF